MKTHHLKLLDEFCDEVLSGEKNFEVRNNDRGFQKGDSVVFHCIEKNGLTATHLINFATFEITYVLSGWGIQPEHVAFGIKKIK